MSSSRPDPAAEAEPDPRRLGRRTLAILALALLPLVLLIGGIAILQYRDLRASLLDDLALQAGEQAAAIANVVQTAERHNLRLRDFMVGRLASATNAPLSPVRDLLQPVTVDTAQGPIAGFSLDAAREKSAALAPGNIFGGPDLGQALDGNAYSVLDAAYGMLEIARLDHAVDADLRWSYFFSKQPKFAATFPFAPVGEMLREVKDLATPDIGSVIANWQTYEIFRRAEPADNPAGTSYWTAPYEDAAGAGAMISHGTPVLAGGQFLGIVGSDVKLSAFADLLRTRVRPVGQLALLDDRGRQLASTDGDTVLAPPPVSAIAPQAAAQAGWRLAGEEWVSVRRIGATPFFLAQSLPAAELRRLLMPLLLPYAAVLVGLLTTLGLLLLLLRNAVIGPALALVRHIGQESLGPVTHPPALPRAWQPWVAMVSGAFRRSRDYLERVRASEARYRAVVETQTEFVARLDPSGRVTFMNAPYRRHLALMHDNIDAPDFSDFLLIFPDDVPRHDRHLQGLTPGNPTATIELRAIYLDGSLHWEEWTDTAIFDEAGKLVEIQAVGREITERKKTEDALRLSEARLSAFMQNTPVAVLMEDVGGEIFMANPQAGALFGRSGADLLGARTIDLLPPEAAAAHRRDGAAVLQSAQATIREEEHAEFATSQESVIVRFPIPGAEGEPPSLGLVVLDVSRQKAAERELERQRRNALQSEKLAALGSLLAGVAHELNNPLSIVVGYSSMLHDMAADDETRRRAREVHVAAERCARIVKTFLAMARSRPAVRKPVDIGVLLDNVLELSAYGMRADGIEILRNDAGNLPPVPGDADQLHQVFINLVINAQQALQSQPQPRRLSIFSRVEGDCVVVTVADNGPGIDAATLPRIFEPFFTSKPQGVGTGIGLSVTAKIVEAHGGRINVDTAPGQGCRFEIFLPCDFGAGSAADDAPDRVPENLRPASILLVDDEASLAAYVDEMLTEYGHQVTRCADARAALRAVERDEFDIVITDLRMPDLDGVSLARRMVALRPELGRRIIIVTGDALSTRPEDIPYAVLEKPIDAALLLGLIETLLADEAASVADH